jgi:protein-disulfide isomerase
MKIDCYMSLACSSEELLRENLAEALKLEGIDAEVDYRRIDEEEALRLGFTGSPAVVIDGVDAIPGDVSGFA